MKIFAVIFAVACGFGAADNSKCSTTAGRTKACPPGQRCIIINLGNPNGPMRTPNSGLCFPGKLDYHAAQSYFEQQDVDKSGQINFGGSYAALSKLEPKATEAQLSKLTNDPKTGLMHRGKVSYITFLKMYRTLHEEITHTGTNPCSADPCSVGQTCRLCKDPKGYCCAAITTASPTSKKLTHDERSQVNNIFTALNTDHASKTLSKAEFAELLNAITKDLDRTHNVKMFNAVKQSIYLSADANNDGVVDYVEFVKACTALKNADSNDFGEFLKAAETLKPLKIGSVCSPSKNSANGKACPKGSTCQQAPIPAGHTVTVRRYTCKKDVALTKGQNAQVGNMFHALDIDHNGKLSHTEMYNLLNVVRQNMDRKSPTYQEAYEAITRNVYFNADANKDKYVSQKEFHVACTNLKNADPTDFDSFLKAAHILYPLHVGNTCIPFRPVGYAKACPKGVTCQVHQTATTKKPKKSALPGYHPTTLPPHGATTSPVVWTCVRNKGLTNDEKHQVSNIFTALDKNHDGKLAHYSELYQLLRTVRSTFSYSSMEYQVISHSMYYDADINKDGYVSKQEFFAGVTTLKSANPAGFPQFLQACEKLQPLSIGDVCQPSMYSYNFQACPKGSTCQLQKAKKTMTTTTSHPGHVVYSPSTYTCIKDVALTKREKAQANNIFHALDANHDKKISRTEMSDLLHAISDWAQEHNNHNLYLAVSRSVYTSYSDTNKDNYVEMNEFLQGCGKLKNMDPQDFSQFLKTARNIKPLKIGSKCKPYRSSYTDGACPPGSTCQVDMKSVMTTTTAADHHYHYTERTYTCVKDIVLTKNEKSIAFNLFSALDSRKEHKLNSMELSRLLQGVEAAVDSSHYPALIEAVSRSTYFNNVDLNKDHYIEFNEFFKIVTAIKNRDPKDFSVFLKAASTFKKLTTGSVCRPTSQGEECPKGNTCQLSQKASGHPPIMVDDIRPRQLGQDAHTTWGGRPTMVPMPTTFGPPSYTAPKYICAHDVKLTSDERAKAITLFHAMDTSKNNKLSSYEFSSLLHAVYLDSRTSHDSSLRTAIYTSLYYSASDTNKDHYVDLNEFIAGCTKLKNRDPKDFPEFMKIAASLKALKEGSACTPGNACPSGTTCRSSNGKYTCTRYTRYTDCRQHSDCNAKKPCYQSGGTCHPADSKGLCKTDQYKCDHFAAVVTTDPWSFFTPDGGVVHVNGRRK